ncbi:MAG TPA: putative hydro-lyase [Thermoplasmata archaeon]|nr:putative hydro-lyase [Thermoplasmata archaeon]
MESEALKTRLKIRRGEWGRPTTGLGFEQANLVILPKRYAYDFLLFCQRNPKPCPLIEVGDEGSYEARCAPKSDIRFDVPKYRIYKKGKLAEECEDIEKYWKSDLIFFLLGCSFTFERELIDRGIKLKHLEQGKNVAMYNTNLKCNPAGVFEGEMVVSMRPIKHRDLVKTIEITSKFKKAHGPPVHLGSPAEIGIKALDVPDYGNPIDIDEREIPVFWACGVTPQLIALRKKLDFMITHSPGHMLILG